MKWNELRELNQLEEITRESEEKIILIFKHSIYCSTSRVALDRLQRNWKDEEMQLVKPYFLDLISYRKISDQIAEIYGIEHESPQVVMVKNGRAIFSESHWGIDYQAIKSKLKS
jgi:bacillithiol system protein YtxJ